MDKLPDPYWRSDCGKYTIFNGDCMEILPMLGAVDAVVTDPPYGVNAVVGGKCFGTSNACATNEYRPIVGDDKPFDPSHLLGLADIACIWGANHFADKLPSRARWLIWDKRDGTEPNPMADCEMAWTSDTRPARLFHHRWMGMIRESERGPRIHPSQKPVQLMRWAMDVLEIPTNALVLDPYLGGGSTGVACVKTDRRFIGIELDPDYCAIAKRRISEEANHLFQ